MKYEKFGNFLNDIQLQKIAELNKFKSNLKKNYKNGFLIFIGVYLLTCIVSRLIWISPLLDSKNPIVTTLSGFIFLFSVGFSFFGFFFVIIFLFGSIEKKPLPRFYPKNYDFRPKRIPEFFSVGQKKNIILYISRCKEELFRSILELLIDQLEYYPNQFLNYEKVIESELFPSLYSLANIDSCELKLEGNDYISGVVDNSSVEFSEIDIIVNNYSNEKKELVNSYSEFHGLFLKADLNQNYRNKTFIIAKPWSNFTSKDNLKKISLQNLLFSKHFEVFSEDEIEARIILSPIILENLANFAEKFHATIKISFINNQLFFAYEMGSFLEPDLGDFFPQRKLNFELLKIDAYKIYEEINCVSCLINDLRLNIRKKNY